MPIQKTLLHSVLIATTLLLTQFADAQPYALQYRKPYTWMVGVSWTAVEDDGRGLCQMFDVNQSWNYEFFPTRVFVDKYFKYGLSAEFSGAFVKYRAGKLINDSTNRSGSFLAFDLNCKYSFYPLITPKWVDPYVSLGLGITQRTAMPDITTVTGNIGLGVNLFFFRGLGFQLQTSGKVALTGGFFGKGNYLQHQAGLVYKFDSGIRGTTNFNKRHYKWTSKKMKYKGGKRGG